MHSGREGNETFYLFVLTLPVSEKDQKEAKYHENTQTKLGES